MKKDLATQYNGISEKYESLRLSFNQVSDAIFIKMLSRFISQTTHAIDFACGDGDMIKYLQEMSIACVGVDSSSDMVALAQKNTNADIRCEDFTETSFASESFDLITSKWAMQTSVEIAPIYKEAARLLKKKGYLAFLVTHPLRQFIEKKKTGKDYFKKEIVESVIFAGAITVHEPTHTFREYLGKDFTKYFSLVDIEEGPEFPAAEKIGGDNYPTYLIIVAQKK